MFITGEVKPKQGVRIGEYPPHEGSQDDGNCILGWIEPAKKNPSWILWFTKKGDAILYTKRGPTGAIEGDPINVKA